ncbi:MAG: aminotransferase class IV [Anaerolineae bacterium]
MSELLVYCNGALVPDSQAAISIHDGGFLLGDSVYEAVRTFRLVPFHLEPHLERLWRSLTYARIDPGVGRQELKGAVLATLEANRPMLDDDVWIYIYITRGRFVNNVQYYLPATAEERRPTVVIFCRRLPFAAFARGYAHGVHAVIPPSRHLPAQCLDPKLKTGSRMHLVLAEFEARMVDPEAWSLILDVHGNITENKSGNVFLVKDGALYTPPADGVLAGVTRAAVLELAGKLGIPAYERTLQAYHALTADEAFFTSTGYCIMPITRVNNVVIGDGRPGPLTRRLLQAWGEMVGVDLVEQARRHLGS